VAFFASDRGRRAVARLGELGIAPVAARLATAPVRGVFYGLTFVVTGTLPTLAREGAGPKQEGAGGTGSPRGAGWRTGR